MIRIAFQPCCGLVRAIPADTNVGGTFTLVPCPRCGAGFYGRLVESDLIEQLVEPTQPNLGVVRCVS